MYTCDITQRYFTLHLYKMAMIFPKDTDGDGKLTLSERLGVAVPVGGCPVWISMGW